MKTTGKVQRLILDELAAAVDRMGRQKAYVLATDIAWTLRKLDLGLDKDADVDPSDVRRADYVSVCRAARTLAARGLVSIGLRTLLRESYARLFICPPGTIEDDRRRGLADRLSRRVVEILVDIRDGRETGRGVPPGPKIPHGWLRRRLRQDAGDKCGEWSIAKAVERAIRKAEDRGEIVVHREYVHGSRGWSETPVARFVSLSATTPTGQQADGLVESSTT